MALAYKVAGKLDLALPLYVETLEKLTAKQGADHPDTLQTMSNLAVAYLQARRFAKAEPLLQQWVASKRPKLPADDLSLALRLKFLGECRVELKKYAEAEQLLRDSLAIYLKKQPSSLLRYNTESLLGAALAGQKKFAEAEPLVVNSAKMLVAIAANLQPSQRDFVLLAVQRVIDLYDAWERPDDAAKWRKQLEELKKLPLP
jgi:hypothetical protein